MLDDAKEFLEPFGRVLSFEFLRIDPPEIRAIYSDLEEARAAVNTLNGLVLGGEAIRTYSLSDVQSITSTAPFCADVPTKLPVFSHSDFNAYVTLYNAVQLDDIEDEDEAQETLRDISYLCQPYGVPSNISLKIFHNSSDFYKIEEFPAHHYVEYSNHIIPELNHPQDEESEQELDFPVAMIKFSDFQRTISQAEVIHGKIIGGAEIQISFYDFWCFEQADYRPENIISLHDLRDTYCGIRFIYSKGLISIGDIIDEATSSLREMILHQPTSRLGDVITHLRPFIPIVQTSHQSEIILAGLHFLDAMEIFQLISQLYGGVSNNPFLEKLSSIDLVISLFAPRSNQQNCDFLTICHGYPSYHNGSFLHFCQETILVVGGFIAMEDLEDLKTFPEEIIAIKKDLLSLFEIDTEISSNFYCKSCHFVTTPYGGSPICYQFQSNNPVVAVNLEFSKRSEAEDVMLALHGTLLGGETIIGELVLCPPSELQSLKPSEENVLDPPIPSISDEVNINSIDKSSVPKLPKHEIPSHPIPVCISP